MPHCFRDIVMVAITSSLFLLGLLPLSFSGFGEDESSFFPYIIHAYVVVLVLDGGGVVGGSDVEEEGDCFMDRVSKCCWIWM